MESAGWYKISLAQILEIDPEVDEISPIKMQPYNTKYFGEGLTLFDDNTYIALTWQNKKMMLLDRETLTIKKEVDYPPELKEGWGITHNE